MTISVIPVSIAPMVAIPKVSIQVIPSEMGKDVVQITHAAPFQITYNRSGQLAGVLTDRHIENCQDLVITAVALSLRFVDYHESNSAA